MPNGNNSPHGGQTDKKMLIYQRSIFQKSTFLDPNTNNFNLFLMLIKFDRPIKWAGLAT